MGLILCGKNKTAFHLSYDQGGAIESVVSEALGRRIVLDAVPESECKVWKDALRNSISRIRLFKGEFDDGNGYEFLAIEGSDLRRLIPIYYKHYKPNFTPSWNMARELNKEWMETISGFADFLETCGGIIRIE